MTTTHDRVQGVAFTLFSRDGYDSTSVDDIAAAAGISRSTFFRLFGSKEAVVFPDHDRLLGLVRSRLEASTEESSLAAVSDAVRLVLFHYVSEGERARERYRLTSKVAALRERELVSGARYHRLFRQFIVEHGDTSQTADLRAELMAAAVVAAHNRVLRRWLRQQCKDPQVEIDEALRMVVEVHGVSRSVPAIVVLPPGGSLEEVLDSLIGAHSTTPPPRRGHR
jgi:AcrR family transcriptional regulator